MGVNIIKENVKFKLLAVKNGSGVDYVMMMNIWDLKDPVPKKE